MAGLDDVVTNFRLAWHRINNLDPLHGALSAPGAAWDSFCEEVTPEYQIEMIPSAAIERAFPVRGGVSYIGTRKQDFNVPGQPGYAADKPTSVAKSYDMTSLYPSVMNFYTYPISDFRTMSAEEVSEFTNEFVSALPVESDKHWQLCVNASVPDGLHDYFDQYPPFA